MQPLALHVHGLHSFREPVDVDLAHLGEHGLFGVFGPVGSGKSTLLDAMTLALYGQVDRLVGRSRRGIVNHQSRRCEVRLRFRVGEQAWEAQRSYRSDAEGNAVRLHSRLARVLPDRLEVVADKEREMNAAVEGLLGLSAADFMRAVVLPQGRFMQFLHLQGTDRRRMLQRIFHLEAYGEGLRARVKLRSDAVEGELQRALGELDGLGPAGDGDREEAARAVSRGEQAAKDARTALSEAQAAWEAGQRALAHHQALAAARTELAQHLERAEAMTTQRAQVADARRVRPALRQLRVHRDALGAREEAAIGASRAAERSTLARDRSATVSASLAAADLARATELPVLEARRQGLVVATRLLRELEQVTERNHKLAQRRGQLRRRHEEDASALIQLESGLEGFVARRTEARSAWSDASVEPALREQVRDAEAAAVSLETARKRADATRASAEDARLRAEDAETAADRAEQAGRAARIRRAAVVADQARWLAQREHARPWSTACREARTRGLIERLASASAELSRAEAGHARDAADRDLARAELASHEASHPTRAVLAGVLAAGLTEGPCDVCGSTAHPSPAPHRTEADLLATLEGLARARATLDARERSVRSSEIAVEQARARAAGITAEIPALLAGDLAGCLAREAAVRDALERADERAVRTLAGLDRGLDDARALLASARARADAAREERERLIVEHEGAADRAARTWDQLTAALGALTLFDLPRLAREISEKDRRRSDLEPTVRRAEADLAAAQREWETRRTAHAARVTELERVKVEHDATEAQRQDLLARIREVCPTGEPNAALAEVDAHRSALDAEVQRARAELDGARAELLAATAEEAGAQAGLRAADQRVARSGLTLRAELDGEDPSTLEARALEGSDLDALEAEARVWSERRAGLALRAETLESAPVPPIDPPELAARAQLRDDAELLRRSAEDALARARERHAALEARAARVAALEVRHRALSVDASRLGTLSRLLRGDRFVEYVANDHLADLVREATSHLGALTRGRYALDLDADGGFLVLDLDAGGASRPAASLSGGETFLTSLALALALSTQVQRHNRNALEFFFLDEGFGSLDPEALDRVMTAIEGLGGGKRVIGLISHVGAVRERVPRYLELSCPRDGGGTRVTVREG